VLGGISEVFCLHLQIKTTRGVEQINQLDPWTRWMWHGVYGF
jgi:hypothetical protein